MEWWDRLAENKRYPFVAAETEIEGETRLELSLLAWAVGTASMLAALGSAILNLGFTGWAIGIGCVAAGLSAVIAPR